MKREEFIKKYWMPYPTAQSSWVGVGGQNSKGQIICGRLMGECLVAGGASIEVKFSDDCEWLSSQSKNCLFAKNLLQDGDLVAVRFGALNRVDRVLLLAPGQPISDAGFNVAKSRSWDDFMSSVREFFRGKGFVEAATPTLVPSPGTEPFLDPFATTWEIGSNKQKLFLPTSPEFHLKKMLVRGWTKIFEFKTCFRNGEVGRYHQPEFWMLEWYRAYANLDAIADDVEALLQDLSSKLKVQIPKMQKVTMSDLFKKEFGFTLTATTTRDELLRLSEKEQIQVSSDDSWDDVFFRIFLERIERKLGENGPLLVRGYPPSQAALSRIDENGFADRFEVYWRGLELANAFHELNDPFENEKRFREDALKKRELGKPAVPVDEELIAHLHAGMPPSGGIALGLDRLFMAIYEIERIEDTRAFPKQQL
jgi:lysyl-tRNA synthetase class 2